MGRRGAEDFRVRRERHHAERLLLAHVRRRGLQSQWSQHTNKPQVQTAPPTSVIATFVSLSCQSSYTYMHKWSACIIYTCVCACALHSNFVCSVHPQCTSLNELTCVCVCVLCMHYLCGQVFFEGGVHSSSNDSCMFNVSQGLPPQTWTTTIRGCSKF
jgi:hypothetical protein